MDIQTALLELLAAIVAGALLGFERELHGRAAGFRTTTLVSFASCLLMIVSIHGFGNNTYDRARVAAAVVSGMGFLGAGAIIRHSEHSVQGVTTAATLWCAMAIGIAFGAGGSFMWLGMIATGLAYAVLGAFNLIEKRILSNRYVEFAVNFDGKAMQVATLMDTVRTFPIRIVSLRYGTNDTDGLRHVIFTLCYKAQRAGGLSVPLTDKVASLAGVRTVEWQG